MSDPLYVRYSVRDERWRDDQYLYIAELIQNCRVLSGRLEEAQNYSKEVRNKLRASESQVEQLDKICKQLGGASLG